jgi:D-lactate dehydrogenase (cytochrome)
MLKALPLFIPLRGVLRKDNYTMQWTSMLIWLYFTEGIVRAYSDINLLSVKLAWMEVILSVTYVTGVLGYLRPIKKEAKKPERVRMNEFIQQCRNAIGASYVLTDKEDTFAYEQEWRQRLRGNALAVLRPASTQEVARLITICKSFGVSVVPQGGNTGLVLGSIPDASGKSVVLSLKRLNNIRAIDTANNTLTAEAGCLLSAIQQAAAKVDRLYPLSLASEGSCTVGGNLSTNAGGTAVLRYGNARDLCLGLEVVTANGDIWDGLRGLRKDNTGYDLRDLFIGAEGTLGIITAATLKLYPAPVANMTVMVALESPEAALLLLNEASKKLGPTLTGFELISRICLQLVIKHIPNQSDPFTQQYPYYVLLETSEHQSAELATVFIRDFLEAQLNQGHILDAVLAENLTQANALWSLRKTFPWHRQRKGKISNTIFPFPFPAFPPSSQQRINY